ncbi:MAG: CHAT domain-containing protein [Planctomycetes bacterium]|nr:CHAT domain-containing protein [Planctomycetota bacterium]
MDETNLLRITQNRIGPDSFSVEVSYEAPGAARQIATSNVKFQLTDQEHEQIRWYLEDYLQFPQDPAPTIAGHVEQHMDEIGKDLFKAIFHSSDDSRDLWATLRTKLNDSRVEVITSVEDAAAIPWELVRDPKTDACLALRAISFVRAHPQGAQAPKLPSLSGEEEAIRILLVICRPGKGDDVPFRSVASRLIKGLTTETYQQYQLDMLRPATYSRLAVVLCRAKADGKPYHIVHFDGHGMYADVKKGASVSEWLKKLRPFMLSGPRTGSHGYLLFENPDNDENTQLIDGPSLGKLLVETDVPVLVLNACRSAHADPKQTPESSTDEVTEYPHAKVRALGSLAHEVMDAGVAGVVAMRYNVYVVTAAHFVADLYGTLVHGQTFGEAVTTGRKQLAADPLREIAFKPRSLQDWCVPVVYEAAPIRLFTPKADTDKLKLTIDTGKAQTETKSLDPMLPKRPDVGFYGRDETLLALDRAFDRQSIVLLHALAGSGKTATAAEFARWYVLTGGLDGGPVLFTSFEHYTPLRTVLGHFGQMFAPMLEKSGVNWSAITDTGEMRDIALQVMKQIPILWICDNVEPVAGFPKGADSAWKPEEQKELVDFLRDAHETKARFLLTSRRDEQDWLGDLPMRISVPAMPLQERVQLARALAEKHGRKITDVEDWRPLLKFTRGNPLTITILVGQALRDKLRSKEDIEKFVEKLRTGEARFKDEKAEGRSTSLGASLSYGFEHAFSEDEQKVLALLHFFQGFVDVDVLKGWEMRRTIGLCPN